MFRCLRSDVERLLLLMIGSADQEHHCKTRGMLPFVFRINDRTRVVITLRIYGPTGCIVALVGKRMCLAAQTLIVVGVVRRHPAIQNCRNRQ